ncbi:MAG: hypothetical protein IT290_07625 [Deltaproteobacteria bacterium]|nr:hypothetical protein [Deltaproteobacteria bacterium]
MARSDSLLSRHETFTAAAAIAAHANASFDGFRQRDFRFVLDLFSNWVEKAFVEGEFALQSTQVKRYLESLVGEGFARATSQKGNPVYRLTRLGLLELLSRLSDRERGHRPEHFFFLVYFLSNYGPRIAALIKAEGKQFPPALRLEIETLLDCREILRAEISRVDFDRKRVQERMEEALKSATLAKKVLAQGGTVQEAAKELERIHPYELNSQKPLSELIAQTPKDLAKWELCVGNERRALQIWKPEIAMIDAYRSQLEEIQKHLADYERDGR